MQKEKLFNKILDFDIFSTSNEVKKSGFWIKQSDKNYSFIISSKKVVNFLFENNSFKCIENIEICNELN